MIETLTCPNCNQTIQSDRTHEIDDSKAVTCNACKLKSLLGQWRSWVNPVSNNVTLPAKSKSQPPELPALQATRVYDNAKVSEAQPNDVYVLLAQWIAAGGLLLTFLAPFFKWVSVGAGGVTGIAGDGKLMLAITFISAMAFIVSITKKTVIVPLMITVQTWGLIVTFWMGALLWKLSTMVNETDLKDNLFAAMLSSMLVSPGIGLYIGLLGGISITGALGYVTAIRLISAKKVRALVAVEIVALCVSLSAVLFFGSFGFLKHEGKNSLALGFGAEASEKEDIIEAELRKPFTLGNLQIIPNGFDLLTLDEFPLFGKMQPRKTKSVVFTFMAKNISEGAVFSAFSKMKVTDNFGNTCPDPTDSITSSSSVMIKSNEILNDLRPGESGRIMVAFDMQFAKANEYTCVLTTQTSNQHEFKKWRIKFSSQIFEKP